MERKDQIEAAPEDWLITGKDDDLVYHLVADWSICVAVYNISWLRAKDGAPDKITLFTIDDWVFFTRYDVQGEMSVEPAHMHVAPHRMFVDAKNLTKDNDKIEGVQIPGKGLILNKVHFDLYGNNTKGTAWCPACGKGLDEYTRSAVDLWFLGRK